MRSPISRLRVVGILEGVSYLVLLGIAMPLKYAAGIPEPVKVVGWIHGILFLLYVVALAHAALAQRWGLKRIAALFVASLVPFGTFVTDRRLRDEERVAAPLAAV